MPVDFRKVSAFCATKRGSRVYDWPVTGSRTLQVRLTVGTSANGSRKADSGSGISNMSDSSMVWNPRMLDPSKPIPSSKTSSPNSLAETEKCCHSPGTSQNLRSTISTLLSFANFITSPAVLMAMAVSSMRVRNIASRPDSPSWSGMASSIQYVAPQKVMPDSQPNWTQIAFFHEVARIEMIKKSASALWANAYGAAQAHR